MGQLRIQDAQAVAYRALCLGALLKRTELEISIQEIDEWSVFDDPQQQLLAKKEQENEKE